MALSNAHTFYIVLIPIKGEIWQLVINPKKTVTN